MRQNKIRVGTRGSPLALWQANWIKMQLQVLHKELEVEIVTIKTSGDKIQDSPLAKIGGKGLFVKEIEEALMRGDIDIAVHSMKDVPINLPDGLIIATITQRENPFDALISKDNTKLADLPVNAKVGTGSLRRATQLLNYRPDFQIIPLRGNVETRIKKLISEGLDAVILAAAGLRRLGWSDMITEIIGPAILLPSVGQGAVGIEAREHDTEVLQMIVDLDHEVTHIALDAERAFLRVLGGGCQVPIAAYATLADNQLTLNALVGSPDGKQILRSNKIGLSQNAESIGNSLGKELLGLGAGKILAEIY
ncbi:MAG: hydroxymethylbilane synthase [Nitrospinae bacterium RIFCSPLOWO2_12_FULL_47_7]|nr:MAG: hydroxymethylbilane synthase [Nitrospinae bacterium RIFCSPLOWO2_12_FULL_47_7]